VALGPVVELLQDGALVEVVDGALLRCLGRALLLDAGQAVVDLDVDAAFLPCLAGRGLLARLIRLPAAFGEDPALAPGRLD
jgi:hypothetical protein